MMLPLILLRLTRIEANVDLKDKGEGVPEGHLQEQRMLGASAATPSNDRLLREFKDEGLQVSAHSRVVQRLSEIQGQGRIKYIQVKEIVHEMSSFKYVEDRRTDQAVFTV